VDLHAGARRPLVAVSDPTDLKPQIEGGSFQRDGRAFVPAISFSRFLCVQPRNATLACAQGYDPLRFDATEGSAMSWDWFERNWMHTGVVAGLFLLSLVPLIVGGWSLPLVLVYLQLPIYMFHQLEEHYDDRFRRFVNDNIAGGLPALTTPAVVVINILGVWVVNLLVLYLAYFADLGFGLIAIYLTLVNAILHVISMIVLRRYNPGLVTALVLFLPVGTWALVAVARAPGVTTTYQILGLAVAVLIHVGILVHVKRRVQALSAA
jgi:hypothetical protein